MGTECAATAAIDFFDLRFCNANPVRRARFVSGHAFGRRTVGRAVVASLYARGVKRTADAASAIVSNCPLMDCFCRAAAGRQVVGFAKFLPLFPSYVFLW